MDSRVTCLIDGVRAPITAEGGIRLNTTSSGRGWEGLHLELGVSKGNAGHNLLANGHMVSMNPTTEPVPIYLRDESETEWVPHLLQPGTFMIHPEGRPFWMISPTPSTWAAAIISRHFLDAIAGGRRELETAVNVDDPVLRHLFWAMIEEADRPSPEEIVARSLVSSFGVALGCRLGRKSMAFAPDGLKPAQLSRLRTWAEQNLGACISVSGMAAQAGLSEAQFSRKFRQSTGRSPWEYIIELRLERARDMLERGETVSSAAAECGFVDQAHLSRLFKRRFDASPAAYVKQGRRAAGRH